MSIGAVSWTQVNNSVPSETAWGFILTITALAASMAVNALMTGLIVFKILKVFLEVKAAGTSVERTLGSTRGTKFQHIIFVIIESGMALFAVQLVNILVQSTIQDGTDADVSNLIITGIFQMFIVIIRSVHFYTGSSFVLLITFIWLGHYTNNNFSAGLNEIIFR